MKPLNPIKPINQNDPPHPIIRRTPPANTPESRAMVLASMPEPVLLQMMASRAEAMDVAWMTSMLEGGLLDASSEMQDAGNPVE